MCRESFSAGKPHDALRNARATSCVLCCGSLRLVSSRLVSLRFVAFEVLKFRARNRERRAWQDARAAMQTIRLMRSAWRVHCLRVCHGALRNTRHNLLSTSLRRDMSSSCGNKLVCCHCCQCETLSSFAGCATAADIEMHAKCELIESCQDRLSRSRAAHLQMATAHAA